MDESRRGSLWQCLRQDARYPDLPKQAVAGAWTFPLQLGLHLGRYCSQYQAVMYYRRLELSLLFSCSCAFLLNAQRRTASATLTMAYTILQATPADLPDIIAIYHAAFANDPFIGQLMVNVPSEVKQAHDMHWYGREFEMCELNGLRFRKVVDGNGYSTIIATPKSTIRSCTHS